MIEMSDIPYDKIAERVGEFLDNADDETYQQFANDNSMLMFILAVAKEMMKRGYNPRQFGKIFDDEMKKGYNWITERFYDFEK